MVLNTYSSLQTCQTSCSLEASPNGFAANLRLSQSPPYTVLLLPLQLLSSERTSRTTRVHNSSPCIACHGRYAKYLHPVSFHHPYAILGDDPATCNKAALARPAAQKPEKTADWQDQAVDLELRLLSVEITAGHLAGWYASTYKHQQPLILDLPPVLQCRLQDSELEQALAENKASLQEILQLRILDPEDAELLQLEQELTEAVRALQGLEAPGSDPESNAERQALPSTANTVLPDGDFGTLETLDTGRPAKRQRLQKRPQGMHPSNQNASVEPNFADLAQRYAELQPFVKFQRKGQASLAFDDPDANRSNPDLLLVGRSKGTHTSA